MTIFVILLGLIWFSYYWDFGDLCAADEQGELARCAREWVSAGAGYLAFVAAVITVTILWRQTSVAQEGLENSRQSSERQLRAYVLLESCKIAGAASGAPEIAVKFQNCGSTPAYRLSCRFQPFVAFGQLDLEQLRNTLPPPENLIDLGPTHSSTAALQVSRADFQVFVAAFQRPGAIFYVLGTLAYRDAFDADHSLQFCMQLEPGRPLADGDLSFAKSGNVAD